MAQEPRSPWSRWDLPSGLRQAGGRAQNAPLLIGVGRQMDSPSAANYESSSSTLLSSPPRPVADATLITKEPNANDASFYNCIYGVPNSLQQIVQECHVDVDCCERSCCDTNWREKYAVAIALLALFCALVLISLCIWLVVWLVNRARDKDQRAKLLETGGQQTPYSSQANITPYAASMSQPNGTLSKNNRQKKQRF